MLANVDRTENLRSCIQTEIDRYPVSWPCLIDLILSAVRTHPLWFILIMLELFPFTWTKFEIFNLCIINVDENIYINMFVIVYLAFCLYFHIVGMKVYIFDILWERWKIEDILDLRTHLKFQKIFFLILRISTKEISKFCFHS